jgi:hypothetical protein
MRNLLSLIFIALIFGAGAQNLKRTPPFSIKGTVGIPQSIGSSMFHTAFSGVYDVGLSANVRAFSNFNVGLAARNLRFQNNKSVFDNIQSITVTTPTGGQSIIAVSYDTKLNCIGYGIRLGYDQFFEKVYMSYGLETGIFDARYINVNENNAIENLPAVAKKFTSPYVQPDIAANFYADGRLNFSVQLGIGVMTKRFDPKAPRFNGIGQVNSKSNKLPMTWINIGFGFAVLLGDI